MGTTICCYSNKFPFLSKEKKYRRRTMSGTLLSHLNRLPPPSVVSTCIFHEKKKLNENFFLFFLKKYTSKKSEDTRFWILFSFVYCRLLSFNYFKLFEQFKWRIHTQKKGRRDVIACGTCSVSSTARLHHHAK
jgi:hypothetical protein